MQKACGNDAGGIYCGIVRANLQAAFPTCKLNCSLPMQRSTLRHRLFGA